ncbi:MAG: tyrosine-type recombinase/integrase [Porticoccus sp.]
MIKKISNSLIKQVEPRNRPYEIADTDIKGFLLRVQPSGVMSFVLSYRNAEGRRQRYTIGKFGSLTPTQARKIASELQAKVKLGVDIQKEKKAKVCAAEVELHGTLGAYLEEVYGKWRRDSRKDAEAELKRIHCHFQQWYGLPLSEIDSWKVEKWRRARKKLGISEKTINRDVNALKAVLSHAVRNGVLDVHPLANIKPYKVDNNEKVRFLSKEEESQLRVTLLRRDMEVRSARISGNIWREARRLPVYPEYQSAHYPDHVEPIILLLLNTGLRPAELLSLRMDDVDLERRLLTVRGINTKSGKTRHVSLSAEATEVLERWLGQSPYFDGDLIFPSPVNGKKMDALPKSIGRVIKKAGLEGFRPYDFRHTFASWLAMGGIDLNTIRELLGHADMSTTLIYAHLSNDYKSEAVKKVFG